MFCRLTDFTTLTESKTKNSINDKKYIKLRSDISWSGFAVYDRSMESQLIASQEKLYRPIRCSTRTIY